MTRTCSVAKTRDDRNSKTMRSYLQTGSAIGRTDREGLGACAIIPQKLLLRREREAFVLEPGAAIPRYREMRRADTMKHDNTMAMTMPACHLQWSVKRG